MEQIQKATLALRSIDADTSNYNTTMIWRNINLRLLLGEMYDQYDNFNLRLVQIASDDDRLYDSGTKTYTNLAGSDNSERIVTLNMSGLNFLNSTYDCYSNVNTSSCIVGTYCFYESFCKEYDGNIVTFTKGSDRCHLSIEYKTVIDNQTPSTLSTYPHMVFLFSIYGIPRSEKK